LEARVDKNTKAKHAVLETCLKLSEEGFLPATGGNIALRVTQRTFAVTPSAMQYRAMSADDICILDLTTLERLEGSSKPSVESGIHACFLRLRSDFTASIHTHQPLASAVSLLNVSLLTNADERKALGDTIPVVPYAPSGTGFLLRAFRKCFRADVAAYLLRNHGLVCGGPTLDKACENTRLVEQVAARFLSARIRSRQSAIPDAALLAQALTAVE
jgi:L-fuculose-phosphate aldolase